MVDARYAATLFSLPAVLPGRVDGSGRSVSLHIPARCQETEENESRNSGSKGTGSDVRQGCVCD